MRFLVALLLVIARPLTALAQIPTIIMAGGKLVPGVPPQTISSITPSSGSCAAGATGSTCAAMTVTMTPPTPLFTPSGALALVSTNAACPGTNNTSGFAISGLNVTLGSATAGNYNVCVQASKTGITTAYQQVAISVTAPGAITPNSATIADDTPSGYFVMAFRIPGQVNTQNCSYTPNGGDTTLSVYNLAFGPEGDTAGRVACEVQTNRQLTSADDGDHTGTVTMGSNSITFTLHVVSPSAVGVTPANINQTMPGWYTFVPADAPGGGNQVAYGESYMTGCGGGWGSPNTAVPVVIDVGPIVCGNEDAADWHSAATGGDDAAWLSNLNNTVGAWISSGTLVLIRIDSEWQGDPSSCGEQYGSPYWNDAGCSNGNGSGPIAAADWEGANQRYINLVHANFPGVLVELDVPHATGGTTFGTYYDMNYVQTVKPDIWGDDLYTVSNYLTAQQTWQQLDGLGGNGYGAASLPWVIGWAAANGTRVAYPEFCDQGDSGNTDPAYILSRLLQTSTDYGLLYEGYWNFGAGVPAGCYMWGTATTVNQGAHDAYYNAFKNWTYQGNYHVP